MRGMEEYSQKILLSTFSRACIENSLHRLELTVSVFMQSCLTFLCLR